MQAEDFLNNEMILTCIQWRFKMHYIFVSLIKNFILMLFFYNFRLY